MMHERSQSASVNGSEVPQRPAHVLVIEAPYYADICELLRAGAVKELTAKNATYEIVRVPGALELPQAFGLAIDAMRFRPHGVIDVDDEDDEAGPSVSADSASGDVQPAQPFDGAIILGCVIRGETSHYDVVCENANHWTMERAMKQGIPLGNALLTVDTHEQAKARAGGAGGGKGADAARACLTLIALRDRFELESELFEGEGVL
ncbi:MAG: 6,7-dimethyl-8-ribityllumazine synthase [Pseudomonadota bacterium]